MTKEEIIARLKNIHSGGREVAEELCNLVDAVLDIASQGANVQSDWNQADNTKPDYIKNKPTLPAAALVETYMSSDIEDGLIAVGGTRFTELKEAFCNQIPVYARLDEGGGDEYYSMVIGNGWKTVNDSDIDILSFYTSGSDTLLSFVAEIPPEENNEDE